MNWKGKESDGRKQVAWMDKKKVFGGKKTEEGRCCAVEGGETPSERLGRERGWEYRLEGGWNDGYCVLKP